MNGGTISGNVASFYSTNTSGDSRGGGVCLSGGLFTMNNGVISDNTTQAYGVGRVETMGGGVYISGGVYINGTFEMKGGTVSDNTGQYGGGVYVNNGTFTMSDGEISGHSALYDGGGVYFQVTSYQYSRTFTISGGKICDNTATRNGGGVYIKSESNSGAGFIISGGKIYGNTAAVVASNGALYIGHGGGGVFVEKSTFYMTGGEIFGNTATSSYDGRGGGVYVYCPDANYSSNGFTKTGGLITGYVDDTANGNVVKDKSGLVNSNGYGHAIYIYYTGRKSGTSVFKDTTSFSGDNLSFYVYDLNLPNRIEGAWNE